MLSPCATRSRIADDETGIAGISKERMRSDVERPRASRAHALVGDARSHRNREAHELEHTFGTLPAGEIGELIRAEDKDGVLELTRLE